MRPSDRVVTASLLAVSALASASCSGADSISSIPTDGALSVSISPKVDTLRVNATRQLVARVYDDQDRPQNHAVDWRSADPDVASVSSLGLVEMTRKRTRDSLEHLLCAACPSCEGRGFVRTPETVCHEIFREIVRQSRQFQSKERLILAHQNVIDRLLDEESAVLAELEHQVGRPIRFQVEALYGFDQYDVVLA